MPLSIWLAIFAGSALILWAARSSEASFSSPTSSEPSSEPAIDTAELGDSEASVYELDAPDFGREIPSPGLAARFELFPVALFTPPPATLAVDTSPRMKLAGLADRLPPWEQEIIVETATRKGVDPRALAAVRLQENGGPGREFGVLSVPAPTYQAQADVAANSLVNAERRYRDATGLSPKDGAGTYTPEFWRFFAARWAPINAENDPHGLNRYWLDNVIAFYQGSSYLA